MSKIRVSPHRKDSHMGKCRALGVALASLLIFTNLLGGCAGSAVKRPGPTGPTGARGTQAPTAKKDPCARHPFGEVKNGVVDRSVSAADAESAAPAAVANVSDAGKILMQARPLDA